jgi:hypothetical protein
MVGRGGKLHGLPSSDEEHHVIDKGPFSRKAHLANVATEKTGNAEVRPDVSEHHTVRLKNGGPPALIS